LLVCAIAKPHWVLWAGVAFQLAMVALLRLIGRGQGWQPLGTSALILYWTAIGWLFLGSGIRELSDPRFNLALAILLVVSVVVFGLQILADSGAQEIRNARMLAQRLEDRKDWPADLASCCDLPEVKELREAVHHDPVPALAMLLQPRPQVRMAALAALEFRKHWEPGQAELVLSVAQHAPEPEVRAGAIMALANMNDRLLVDRLADYLCDPSQGVRRAATEALLWNSEKRWTWIRPAVRKALCDAVQEEDGPLIPNGQLLSSDAVNDLTAWSAEKGVMAIRAALTLGAHYERFRRGGERDRGKDVVGQLKHLCGTRLVAGDRQRAAPQRDQRPDPLYGGWIARHHDLQSTGPRPRRSPGDRAIDNRHSACRYSLLDLAHEGHPDRAGVD